jgi:hypothetical protein
LPGNDFMIGPGYSHRAWVSYELSLVFRSIAPCMVNLIYSLKHVYTLNMIIPDNY